MRCTGRPRAQSWRSVLPFIASALRAAAVAALVVLAVPARAHAQQGGQITIIVGTPVGGGYDAYARLAGRHLGALLSRKSRIVIQNMPGAGSLIAANWLANTAPRDGSVIGILPNATIFESLLGNHEAHFDAHKLKILGSLNNFTAVAMVWRQTGFTTARDLFTHEVLVGASSAASSNSVLPNLLNSLIRTKFKVVNGYRGSAGIALALERGEVQAMVGDSWDSIKSTKADWIRDKKIRVLMQATLTRHPDLPEVPTALEFVKPEDRDVLALLLARQTYAGLFLAPPGTPDAVVADLRQAMDKMVESADFRRDAERSKLVIEPAGAAEVQATLSKLLESPQPVVARASSELRRVVAPK
jgi:tripartite-type tricarboxylate transporter receptor subunit TctC